ncbi:MAG: excinuclease ABC subunit C [Candidatus Buchananbacteria bacterium RIFCSPLOWO2_01_FULL_46_12]|uniref:Excinuclease ABC subunit C n=1 Tax=Candidatus Buchananbacteria bacterium RIFCSPLOWO2_01_FULL_46_12 TaxID=1797546 RepID=A0A1G1YN41_9BACT|nr:MAG: excinuclease ABC subunit C [Candidatus Buchananbacteria bacterium RIFCSPLOWO2_01_FULL_46_12]
MFYYVYVLQSLKDNHFYTGSTANLEQRIADHNAGKTKSTQNRRPLKLIYFEGYLNKIDAAKREIFLKSGSGKRYIKKQLAHYLNLNLLINNKK